MKKLLMLTSLCCLLSWESGGLAAQEFSIPEVEALAEFLYLDNLLSEEGKEELKFRAREGDLRTTTDALLANGDRTGTISATQVLRFLADGYQSAYFHRNGLGIYIDLVRERRIFDSSGLDSLAKQAIWEVVQKRLREQPGNQLEQERAAARRTDSLTLRMEKKPAMSFLMGNDRFGDRIIPSSRSAFGYDLLETLASLRTLRLIPEDTYAAYLADIGENGLLPDYQVLEALTKTAGDRETRAWRTAQRSRALDWLEDHQLLMAGTMERFAGDTTFLAATDGYNLYPLLRGINTIRLVAPDDLGDLARQFSAALCGFDSLFCGLSVEVVSTPASPGRQGGPLFRIVSAYQGKEISRSEDWEAPTGDRDLLSWVGRYPLEVFMAPYNTLLDSLNAAYRLYYAFPTEHDGLDIRDLLLMPLDSRAARVVADPAVRRVQEHLSGPEPSGFLSPGEAAEWLDTLQRLGYFAPLTEEQWETGQECVRNRTVRGATDFFGCFPELHAPFVQGASMGDVDETDPLPVLPGDYYFLLPPGVEGGAIYLRMDEGPAAYLASLLGTDFRKL